MTNTYRNNNQEHLEDEAERVETEDPPLSEMWEDAELEVKEE